MQIIIIGAGKVAWNLTKRFKEKRIFVTMLYNRTRSRALRFHNELSIPITDQLQEIPKNADLYILAISDAAIPSMAQQLSQQGINGLVVHTSGATSGTALQPFFERSGVFYPLQSFSSEILPQWSTIPICIDAQAHNDKRLLHRLGKKIGQNVYPITDAQRSVLHIAAVFANNFTNHLLLVSEQILQSAHIDNAILQPLIAETIRKAKVISPKLAQTGPALRHDTTTIQKHLEFLQNHPEWKSIYTTMTDAIQHEHHIV